ncbi:hypothetical protein M0722_04705 [Microbacterium sp. KSW4-16]|uniref:DUF6541 family protein n=1 Tax=Microbacterium aurugineum TaxID=2851642 RepID=UPI0020BFBAF8|nr:DUF6541 family protein [Microbacterium aurugineum]MCK8466482.1 hypothetical protein [Microbacterium aurugineum]
MLSWAGQVPALLVAIAVIVLPGLPAAMCLRASPLLRVGAAVALSLGIVATATVIAPVFGLAWSPLPVAIVASIVTAIASLLRWTGRGVPGLGGSRTPAVWGALGAAFTGWVVVVALGIADPTHPSQLYDGLFHLNAVEFITQTGDASPLHMTMVTPGAATGTYPTLWHAIVALVVPVSGGVVTATNTVTVAVIAVIWPLAMACLASILFPSRPSVAVWAPLVAFGFSVFPLGFLTWGVLYPNLLGNLLLPLLLSFIVRCFEPGDGRAGKALWILTAAATAAAVAAAHPSSLLAGVALSVPFVVWRALRLWPTGGTTRRVVLVGSLLLGGGLLIAVWLAANVTTHEWLPNETMSQAFGEVAFLSPVGRTAGLLLGPLAAIGIWRVVKDRQWWILYSYGVSIAFYLASAWFPVLSLRSLAVGVWYDDTTRVGALLAMWGIPLAGLGAAVVVSWVGDRWRNGSRLLAGAISGLLVLGAATHIPAVVNDLSYMRNSSFAFTPDSQGLSSDEEALFEKIAGRLNSEDIVLGDPLTGAGLLFAYTGHRVVFPHVTGRYGADAELLARSFSEGGEVVCDAAARLGVTFVLDFGDRQLFENHWTTFDGLHHLADSPLLSEVDRVGDAVLYEVTGCG